jgi:hypothetical protein
MNSLGEFVHVAQIDDLGGGGGGGVAKESVDDLTDCHDHLLGICMYAFGMCVSVYVCMSMCSTHTMCIVCVIQLHASARPYRPT